MAILTLDDRSGRFEAMLYTEAYEEFSQLLVKDKVLVVEGEVSFDNYNDSLKMIVRNVMDMPGARERFSKGILLEVDQSKIKGEFAESLSQSLEPYRDGDCLITVIYSNDKAKGCVKFSDNWGISPTDDLLYRLSDIPGCTNVQVKYN